MKPRITVVSIGVDDLDRALRFYRDGLGVRTEGIAGKEFEHGAVIVKRVQDTFWGGYAGYFQDPGRHLWEVIWNPQRVAQD